MEPDLERLQNGAVGQQWATTSWTEVVKAKGGSKTALDSLWTKHHSVLVSCLRGRGVKPEAAEDLVQGFFLHLLEHDFLARVAREKGRFRTFLRTAFRHYLSDEKDKAATQKRGGGQVLDSLDETDDQGHLLREVSGSNAAPDLAFDRKWARATLARALDRLSEEHTQDGRGALYVALEPALFADPDAHAYKEIGLKLGMGEAAVKMAAHRARKRLGDIIRDDVRETLAEETDLEDELRYLRSLFGKR